MLEIKDVIQAIKEVICNEELFKTLILKALKEAYDEHQSSDGTSVAAKSTGILSGLVSPIVSAAWTYGKGTGYLTTPAFNQRMKSVLVIQNRINTGDFTPIRAFWELAQEGHWNVTSLPDFPSYNTKFMRHFALVCYARKYGSIETDQLKADDLAGLELMAKDLYQIVIQDHIQVPELFSIYKKAGLNSRYCADLLAILAKHNVIQGVDFKQLVLDAALRAYNDHAGFGIRRTNGYEERLSNVDKVIKRLDKSEINPLEAVFLLSEEGNWNTQSLTHYPSYNTKFMRYLIQSVAKSLTCQTLYEEVRDNESRLDTIAKEIYVDLLGKIIKDFHSAAVKVAQDKESCQSSFHSEPESISTEASASADTYYSSYSQTPPNESLSYKRQNSSQSSVSPNDLDYMRQAYMQLYQPRNSQFSTVSSPSRSNNLFYDYDQEQAHNEQKTTTTTTSTYQMSVPWNQ